MNKLLKKTRNIVYIFVEIVWFKSIFSFFLTFFSSSF